MAIDYKTVAIFLMIVVTITFLLNIGVLVVFGIMTPSDFADKISKRIHDALEKGVYLKKYPTQEPIKVFLDTRGPNWFILKTTYNFGGGIDLPYRKYGKTWALTKEELK